MKFKLYCALLGCSAILSAQEITDLDPNFRQETVGNMQVKFGDVRKSPFLVTGFAFRKGEDDSFHRLPSDFTEKEVGKNALTLAGHSSGAAVLFRTDSPYIALKSFPLSGTTPFTGISGYDLYERLPDHKQHFLTNIRTTKEGNVVKVGSKGMRDYIIYLPLYSIVVNLQVGVKPEARFEKPTPQRLAKPIVFYGSSITQGGCASRPGNNYTTMICRALDVPQINLGLSGNALGQPIVAEAIASIDAAMFVLDYDANAPTVEHLQNTHEPFFKIIRKKRPDMPILMLSNPNGEKDAPRYKVILQTYENAVKSGDKNVYFIAGDTLFGEAGPDNSTVDGIHPNDLGFYMMFKNILPTIQKALNLK